MNQFYFRKEIWLNISSENFSAKFSHAEAFKWSVLFTENFWTIPSTERLKMPPFLNGDFFWLHRQYFLSKQHRA